MHKLALPRSDQQRLKLLSFICNRPEVSFKGQTLLTTQLQQKVTHIYNLYQQSFKEHSQQQRLYREQLALRDKLMPKLVKTVRLFVSRVRIRATYADGELGALFAEYQLHPKRNDPNYKNPNQWLAQASTLINAEERLITQGLRPIAQPGIQDLQATHDPAAAAVLATARLSQDLGHAAIRLSAVRTKVAQALRQLAAWLRYRLSAEQAPVRRAIFRSLGFRFTRQETPAATQTQAPTRDQCPSEQLQAQGVTCDEAMPELGRLQPEPNASRSSEAPDKQAKACSTFTSPSLRPALMWRRFAGGNGVLQLGNVAHAFSLCSPSEAPEANKLKHVGRLPVRPSVPL